MVRYIVLEGIDGSGKTEVAKRLSALTPDYMLTREPTERLGPVIMVNDSPWADVLLFAADRALLMEDVNRWLGEGRGVISDRSIYSSMAYQGAALKDDLGGLHGAFKWIEEVNRPFLLQPDTVLLLDLPVDIAMSRVSDRGDATRFERMSYLEDVRSAYAILAEENGFKIIDATRSLDEVVRLSAEALGL